MLCTLLQGCCWDTKIIPEIAFYFYDRDSEKYTEVPPEAKLYTQREKVRNLYPNFIGHWDFKLSQIEKKPLSASFWLGIFTMVAGALALIVAFAFFLQAAALSVKAVAAVSIGIGVASLYGGFSMFHKERQKHTNSTRYMEEKIQSWRPATAP